jgi:hypothetical protein
MQGACTVATSMHPHGVPATRCKPSPTRCKPTPRAAAMQALHASVLAGSAVPARHRSSDRGHVSPASRLDHCCTLESPPALGRACPSALRSLHSRWPHGSGWHLVDLEDLAVGLLDTVKHRHVVPETGLRHDLVGREDVHLVDVRLAGALLRRRLEAADHLHAEAHRVSFWAPPGRYLALRRDEEPSTPTTPCPPAPPLLTGLGLPDSHSAMLSSDWPSQPLRKPRRAVNLPVPLTEGSENYLVLVVLAVHRARLLQPALLGDLRRHHD